MAKNKGKVGILTFHCSDNLGAMLQAYGLLTRLNREGFEAFIINYAPSWLTGRDWFIPYVPYKEPLKRPDVFLWLLKRNIKEGSVFFERRRLMDAFREKYLVKGSRRVRGFGALAKIQADFLVAGSDQIWNPDITLGLKPAYFGAFANNNIRKTVAYAASFGTASLKPEYEAEFAELLNSVDEISTREKDAAQYIRERFGRGAESAVDPVFLPDAEDWESIAEKPARSNYVFYYETQSCAPLREAACETAEKKGLKAIGISLEGGLKNYPIHNAGAVDPAKFLGYISAADYVFTNSFHGLAFSIIMNKKFYVYNHPTVGSRIENLLGGVGLAGRMATENYKPDIDENIDWTEAERLLKIQRENSVEFLNKSLTL